MNAPNKAFLGTTCKQCGAGTYIETDGANEWWVKCDDCSHLLFCYQPMPHQLRFHRDPTKFKMYAGKLNLPA